MLVPVLILVLACSGSPAPDASTPAPDASTSTPEPGAQQDKIEAHGKPGETHEMHGRPHHGGDHATVDHSFADAEKWSEIFDDPERDSWQKPAELVAALDIAPGSTVADIGAGTGYFNAHLSKAVGPEGTVIAVDIEQTLVDHMTKRAERDGTPNVKPRLGKPDDPALAAEEVDLILLVDTYHHIDERVAYFQRLVAAVKPGGRLAVVDFRQGDIPVGPPEDHRIPEDKVIAELVEAGWTDAGTMQDVLPYQFVRVVKRAE